MDSTGAFHFRTWPQFYSCVDQILGKNILLENEHIKFLYNCQRETLGLCCQQAQGKREECAQYYFNLLPTLKENDDFIIKLKEVTGYKKISFFSKEGEILEF